ncbi:hypothetical protein [Nannocystis exedens]|uniref:hypothetical protein n=1 Tax=Nannocystis exedens TaxID=54 RepID=UPI00116049BA|nr:hypothetical protein [Nannocystis exedens]
MLEPDVRPCRVRERLHSARVRRGRRVLRIRAVPLLLIGLLAQDRPPRPSKTSEAQLDADIVVPEMLRSLLIAKAPCEVVVDPANPKRGCITAPRSTSGRSTRAGARTVGSPQIGALRDKSWRRVRRRRAVKRAGELRGWRALAGPRADARGARPEVCAVASA